MYVLDFFKSKVSDTFHWVKKNPIPASAGVLTGVFGIGKLMQTMGQSLFAASQDDAYLNISKEDNAYMTWALMGCTATVTLLSRIPEMQKGFEKILLKIFKKNETTPLSSRNSPDSNDTLADMGNTRKGIYYVTFYFANISGILSCGFAGLSAFQSGATLMAKLQGQPDLLHIEVNDEIIFAAIYATACSTLSWAFFNLTKIFKNSSRLAKTVATAGQSNASFSFKKTLKLSANIALTGSYIVGNSALYIISTRSALDKINSIFIHADEDTFNHAALYAGYVSAIPPILSVILTNGAELHDIFHGELLSIYHEQASQLKKSLFILTLLAGLYDSVVGNAAGFYGGLLQLGQEFFDLSPHKVIAKAPAAISALFSILPYYANNGGRAMQFFKPPKKDIMGTNLLNQSSSSINSSGYGKEYGTFGEHSDNNSVVSSLSTPV